MERQWNEFKSAKKNLPGKVSSYIKKINILLYYSFKTLQSKVQTGIKGQTPQTITRSKRKIATTSSNQASKVRKIGMDHKVVVTKY